MKLLSTSSNKRANRQVEGLCETFDPFAGGTTLLSLRFFLGGGVHDQELVERSPSRDVMHLLARSG